MRDLAVQAANDSNNDEARANIQTEADQLMSELDRIANSTNFNGTKLLDGSSAAELPGRRRRQLGNSQITVNRPGPNVDVASPATPRAAPGADGDRSRHAATSTTGAAT